MPETVFWGISTKHGKTLPPDEAGYPASGTDGKERPAGASDREEALRPPKTTLFLYHPKSRTAWTSGMSPKHFALRNQGGRAV